MRNSEIFDNFVKIAKENGMIPEDAPEKASKILSKTHRMDSLDISAIEALYGVKPNAPKDMEYARNIIEDAHPNSVIISPSYDKINGLLENNNERQDILLNIVNRDPDGHGNLHKNAKKDLILALVRLGNDLDNKNATKLRELSDTCLTQVSLKKNAFLPIAVGIAVALGALYAQQHLAFADKGFQQNHNKLMAEIDDLVSSNSNFGVGTQYTPEFESLLAEFKSKLTNFYAIYQPAHAIIANFEKPRSSKELLALSQKPDTADAGQAYKAIRAAADDMLPYLQQITADFSSEGYKSRQTADKGFFTSLIDRTQVLHGGKGLISDDFDDVVHAIAPYKASIKEILDILVKASTLAQNAKSQIEQATSDSQKDFGSPSSPSASPIAPAKSAGPDDDLEKGLSDITQFGL